MLGHGLCIASYFWVGPFTLMRTYLIFLTFLFLSTSSLVSKLSARIYVSASNSTYERLVCQKNALLCDCVV